MTPGEIVTATGLGKAVVENRLGDMVNDGQVIKLGRGTYAHPDRGACQTHPYILR